MQRLCSANCRPSAFTQSCHLNDRNTSEPAGRPIQATRKTTIGQLVTGRTAKAPNIVMATPIRDKHGIVVGALSEVTNLEKPNRLDKINKDYDR